MPASSEATASSSKKISGQGIAWLELSGEVIIKDLAPGETLRVHPGHVGAFQTSVAFQIQRVPGIKNMVFGGDSVVPGRSFTGPGRVWLQTAPHLQASPINSSTTCPPHTESRSKAVSSVESSAPVLKRNVNASSYSSKPSKIPETNRVPIHRSFISMGRNVKRQPALYRPFFRTTLPGPCI